MSQEVSFTGRCLCGAVNYKVKGTPVRMAHCHCKDCQRSSGAGHMSNAIFRAADVEMHGSTSSYVVTADSGNILTRHFCPTCGSRVFATNSGRPGMIILTAGTMDDHSWFEPQLVIFTRSRAEWDKTDERIPNFETAPPLPPRSQA